MKPEKCFHAQDSVFCLFVRPHTSGVSAGTPREHRGETFQPSGYTGGAVSKSAHTFLSMCDLWPQLRLCTSTRSLALFLSSAPPPLSWFKDNTPLHTSQTWCINITPLLRPRSEPGFSSDSLLSFPPTGGPCCVTPLWPHPPPTCCCLFNPDCSWREILRANSLTIC